MKHFLLKLVETQKKQHMYVQIFFLNCRHTLALHITSIKYEY